MTIQEETIVELSKVKLVLITLGAFAFVGIGIWMLVLEDKTIDGTRYTEPEYAVILAILAISFFGLCGLFGLKKLVDRSPGLRLTPDGFYDNSSGVSIGLVPWSDVSGISEYTIQGQRFVSVLLKDPEAYVVRGGTLRRMANRANLKMCGTPINVASNSLKIGYDDLLKLFQTYYEWSRVRAGQSDGSGRD